MTWFVAIKFLCVGFCLAGAVAHRLLARDGGHR